MVFTESVLVFAIKTSCEGIYSLTRTFMLSLGSRHPLLVENPLLYAFSALPNSILPLKGPWSRPSHAVGVGLMGHVRRVTTEPAGFHYHGLPRLLFPLSSIYRPLALNRPVVPFMGSFRQQGVVEALETAEHYSPHFIYSALAPLRRPTCPAQTQTRHSLSSHRAL